MSSSSDNAPLTASHLAVSDIVAVLRKAGSRYITEEALRTDLAAGAPANPDGTINILHYAAWMAKEADNAHA
jgi:hypothetical protein